MACIDNRRIARVAKLAGAPHDANAGIACGLRVGDAVVVGQSYLVKADIEKAGASHDH